MPPRTPLVSHMDRAQGEFVTRLNFARESLIELYVPLLFWFSEKKMKNQIYSVRTKIRLFLDRSYNSR